MLGPSEMDCKVEEYTRYMCITLLCIIILCMVLLVMQLVVGYLTSISIGV